MKRIKRLFTAFIAVMIAACSLGAMTASAGYDGLKPKKVSITPSSITVYQGKEFELKATMSPRYADDDYLRWEIVSGKKYVKFEDNDRDGDEIDLVALKPGTAKIRCYVKGKSKTKYGDVIKVTVRKRKANYTLSRVSKASRTVEIGDDFELKVKKGYSIKEKQLKWTIEDTSIIGFEDNDKYGDDVEFIAKKAGTTRIACLCTNKNAKVKKIMFKITVNPDTDDDVLDGIWD